MKHYIIAGNWKMNTRPSEGLQLLNSICSGLSELSIPANLKVIAFPPHTHLQGAVAATSGIALDIGAQNMHYEAAGAFTGEVSADMLKDLDVEHVIIGHSERRQYFNETNESCNRKLHAAISHSLIPLYCIGETLAEREAERHFAVADEQLEVGLKNVNISRSSQLVIAYEPVWAIGTGRTASPQQAEEIHAHIRRRLIGRFGESIGSEISILYGGSMNAANASGLLAQPNIDGGLIGGASLKTADFLSIVNSALAQIG